MTDTTNSDTEQFLDLIIFEESLRREYLKLKRLRRKYSAVLLALLLWNIYFLYSVWIAPSSHRLIGFIHRVGCLAGLSILVLFYVSGLYHDTIVQPRRFIPQANRGLRHFNVKLVVTNRGWLRLFKKTEPGGDVRLIVSSKAGTLHFREAFETYRASYWDQVRKNEDAGAKMQKNGKHKHSAHSHKKS